MLRRLPLALFALWLGWAALAPAGAEPVFPLGLRIGLEPPGDMKAHGQFPGFQDEANKASITIAELPGRTYKELEQAMAAENPRGLTEARRESFPYAKGVGVLVTGVSMENDVPVRHWFMLAGAEADLTALINVAVPESAKAAYPEAAIRKALATVSFRPTPLDEQLGMMPFKLNELAGFRVMQVLRDGAVVLTDGPTDMLDNQPSVIVSIGPGGPSNPSDRPMFARDLLTASPFRDLSLQSSEPMRISGLPGQEIRALARTADGNQLSLVQWVRFGSGGFLRVIAFTHTDDWNTQFPRFRAVRDGVQMR